ncbi:hypothetical protein BDF19DRAFT_462017 [Syncephalis fuscata]|nr:hypothetical protein BDF19DRAFT_462017 [Syncephalis fuscata]
MHNILQVLRLTNGIMLRRQSVIEQQIFTEQLYRLSACELRQTQSEQLHRIRRETILAALPDRFDATKQLVEHRPLLGYAANEIINKWLLEFDQKLQNTRQQLVELFQQPSLEQHDDIKTPNKLIVLLQTVWHQLYKIQYRLSPFGEWWIKLRRRLKTIMQKTSQLVYSYPNLCNTQTSSQVATSSASSVSISNIQSVHSANYSSNSSHQSYHPILAYSSSSANSI